MSTDRQCPACEWRAPAFLPDDLVPAAMADHRANDCSPIASPIAGLARPSAASDGAASAEVAL